MMTEDKRNTALPTKLLETLVDDAAIKLSGLLSQDFENSNKVTDIDHALSTTKEAYNYYVTHSKLLSTRLYDSGARSRSREERRKRNTLHHETFQTIKELNEIRVNIYNADAVSNVDDLSDTSSVISSASNLNKTPPNAINIELNTPRPVNSELNAERNVNDVALPFNSASIPTSRNTSVTSAAAVNVDSTSNTLPNVSYALTENEQVINNYLPGNTTLNINAKEFVNSSVHSNMQSASGEPQQTLSDDRLNLLFKRSVTFNNVHNDADVQHGYDDQCTHVMSSNSQPFSNHFLNYSHRSSNNTIANCRPSVINLGNSLPNSYAAPFCTVGSNNPTNIIPPQGQYVNTNCAQNSRYQKSNEFAPPSHNSIPYSSSQHHAISNVSASDNYLRKMQLFKPSLPKFSGEPHRFHAWVKLMECDLNSVQLTAVETIKVLMANTSDEPLKLIEDHFYAGASNPDLALRNIWIALKRQFGSDSQVSASLLRKIDEFPVVKGMNQGPKVRELLHLCKLIQSYMSDCDELYLFNLSSGQRKLWSKLPDTLQYRWRSYGSDHERNFGSTPKLHDFIHFLELQVNEMCNPNYDKYPSNDTDKFKRTTATKVFKTDTDVLNSNDKKSLDYKDKARSFECCIHESDKHSLSQCKKFSQMSYDEKRKVLINNHRCFKCVGSHLIKNCPENVKCVKCDGNHCELMHNPSYKPKNKTKNSYESSKYTNINENDIHTNETNLCSAMRNDLVCSKSCSKTVLVELTLPDSSSKKLTAYAILDDQSSASFIDPHIVDFFNAHTSNHDYSLKTLQGLQTIVHGKVLKGLHIRGVGLTTTYSLPPLFTNDAIPDTKHEVATPSTVESFPDIKHFAKRFNEFDDNAQVLILIGRNCEHILPIKCYGNKVPYVYETKLGYALVGDICTQGNYNPNSSLSCLRTSMKSIDHEHFEARSASLKSTNDEHKPHLPLINDIFDERPDDELPGHSRDDLKFLETMKENVHLDESGHITLPLPFKDSDPFLPDNQQAVYNRTLNTLNRLKSEPNKLQSCVKSMQANIDAKFVEVVPENEIVPVPGKAWFLPIFPVVNPKKDKVRLVFDSSAIYKGTSLNNQLLKGPDENNRLKGVLHRFRKGPVGFATDVEAMFNQFHVTKPDSDFLRFYWFSQNDPSQKLVQYRARVHIFGNKPSPSIANFGLKYVMMLPSAEQYPEARSFVYDSVYVDDGLNGVNSSTEAIKIIRNTEEVLSKVGVRLCKIDSNSKAVYLMRFLTASMLQFHV